MSESTPPRDAAVEARAEALSWLAGRFRWEALLADLQELAEREAAPVVALEPRSESDSNAA